MLNIAFTPEYIGSVAGIAITNTFFTSILVTLFTATGAIVFSVLLKYRPQSLYVIAIRTGFVKLLQFIDTVTKDREQSFRIIPVIATFFVFILLANLLTVIPGFFGSFFVQHGSQPLPLLRSPNSDLTITLALACCAVGSIQFFSYRTLGIRSYLNRFFSLHNPVSFFLGFFELLSEVVKIISFSFRLFGNIFAGEVLLLVIGFFTPYVIPLPFTILEVFVGIIQAFIFATLTLAFVKTATTHQKL